MNRLDRISAILIQLQSKRLVTSTEIAERFEVSQRTVYRDIKTLMEAGVPIGVEDGKGYFIADGYRLPPVMFTEEEAYALITAEKILTQLNEHSLNQNYASAVIKIRAVLQRRAKRWNTSATAWRMCIRGLRKPRICHRYKAPSQTTGPQAFTT